MENNNKPDSVLLKEVLKHSGNSNNVDGLINFMSDELREKLSKDVQTYHQKYSAYPSKDSRFLRGTKKETPYQFNHKEITS